MKKKIYKERRSELEENILYATNILKKEFEEQIDRDIAYLKSIRNEEESTKKPSLLNRIFRKKKSDK